MERFAISEKYLGIYKKLTIFQKKARRILSEKPNVIKTTNLYRKINNLEMFAKRNWFSKLFLLFKSSLKIILGFADGATTFSIERTIFEFRTKFEGIVLIKTYKFPEIGIPEERSETPIYFFMRKRLLFQYSKE